MTCEEWFSGKNADPVLISLQDGFVATKKEFITTQHHTQEENIFAVGMQTAPLREEDVSLLFCCSKYLSTMQELFISTIQIFKMTEISIKIKSIKKNSQTLK